MHQTKKFRSGLLKNSAAEKLRNEYFKSLVDQGYSQEEINVKLEKATLWVLERFQYYVVRFFSDNDMERWEKFLQSNPTIDEQWIVLEQFYKNRTGVDFQELFTEVWGNYFLQEGVNLWEKHEKEMKQKEEEIALKISKLSGKQKKLLEKYLAEKDLENADRILNNPEKESRLLSWLFK